MDISPYLNVEGNLRRLKALDWRNTMHPDDRAWLAQVEAPLRNLGYEPLLLTEPVPTLPDPGERRARRHPRRGLDSMHVPPPQPSIHSKGAPVDYDG